ncbi:MAG: diaminopimelate dehydrogenase [Victivallaceae bacterium]
MGEKIRIAIAGYGNVGRGVKAAIEASSDMVLCGIVSRNPERVKKELGASDIMVMDINDIAGWTRELSPDLAILCGGSSTDLPVQGPKLAAHLSTVDSFDNHGEIPNYFNAMDKAAHDSGNVAVISTGWDPGIFSLERVLASSFIPGVKPYGFYGLSESGGLSMGHSDAIRRIPGVKDARQYTHAEPDAIAKVRSGGNPVLTAGEMHWRECFIVLEDSADAGAVEETVKNMPNYFAPYRTVVNFITQDELNIRFSGFPHGGCVIASGTTADGGSAQIEYQCNWGSNPAATASVLVAHARATMRLKKDGKSGAFTILDIPPAYFSNLSREELLKKFM